MAIVDRRDLSLEENIAAVMVAMGLRVGRASEADLGGFVRRNPEASLAPLCSAEIKRRKRLNDEEG